MTIRNIEELIEDEQSPAAEHAATAGGRRRRDAAGAVGVTRRVQITAGVLAVVVLAVLAASAPAASVTDAEDLTQAVDGLVVGGEHSSASELSTGSLTNAEVVRSGEAGAVSHGQHLSSARSRYAFDYGSGSTAYDYVGNADGSLNGATTWTANGVEFNGGNWTAPVSTVGFGGNNFSFTATVTPQTQEYLRLGTGDAAASDRVMLLFRENGTVQAGLRDNDGTATGWFGNLSYTPGEKITVALTREGDTFHLIGGNGAEFSHTESGFGIIDPAEDKLSNDVFGQDAAHILHDVRTYNEPVTVSQVERIRQTDGKLSPSAVAGDDATYENDYAVSGNVTVWTDLELENETATVTVEGYDGSSWTDLSSTTYSTSGNKTMQVDAHGYEEVSTRVRFEQTDPRHTGRLDDEGILFTNHAPSASNLSPEDGASLEANTVDFSVDVNDTEFPTAQGDEVTAELFVDGESVGSETVTSNQTVSISESFSEGGSATYYWELTDDYGASTTTDERTVQSPSDLYIRSETNPSNLVTDAQVNITYYYGDELLRANTSDGMVDLTGLPIDEPIIALAEADGYHTRTAVITSVYQQDSLYLLNNSLDTHQLIFDITDPTGAYPRSETILEVQRDIELNGTTEWRTVAGDVFGAQGVTTDLQAGERYRLTIRNLESGERSMLGSFTPTGSQQITLEPESATVDVGLEDNTSIGYGATRSSDGESIIVEYADPEQSTSTLTFMIHERFNESNVLLENQSFSDLGNMSYGQPLSASEQNQSWVVDFSWTKHTGEQSETSVVVGQGPRDGLIPSALDDVYRVSIGVAILLITALLFSQLNVGVGAITTSLVGGLLWYLGFLSGVTTGPAIVLAIGASGLIYYNNGGGAA